MCEEFDPFPNPGSMRLGDYQRLLVCEKQLLKEEKWIKDSLKAIKSERMSLNVEQLQLQSLIASANLKAVPTNEITVEDKLKQKESAVPNAKQLDEVASAYNNKQLDLSVINDLDKILKGQLYANEDMSEEESSEEET